MGIATIWQRDGNSTAWVQVLHPCQLHRIKTFLKIRNNARPFGKVITFFIILKEIYDNERPETQIKLG
ncbi:hypothetical protein KKH3_21710 [Pectobacterium actinidiae]|nr:hypothetical protein KKH3_21710 [Pectobacterium actinidiae]